MTIPRKAFILAAGLGTRLRPYTDTCPKPLIEVGGQTLIDHTLDRLEDIGVEDVIVNTHYHADQLVSHLKNRKSPHIHISHEKTLLDTGGGIKNALEYFGNEPFFVLSGDGLWSDGPDESALQKLASVWDSDLMDILMLLQPVSSMNLTKGAGDYDVNTDGQAVRSQNKNGAYMFTSIRINKPEIFEKTPEGPFSYLTLMDRAEQQGRLYGLVHDGDWHHISTPQDLEAVRKACS